jgi:hypothetical protein
MFHFLCGISGIPVVKFGRLTGSSVADRTGPWSALQTCCSVSPLALKGHQSRILPLGRFDHSSTFHPCREAAGKVRSTGLKGLLIATFSHCHSLELVGDEDDGFVASLVPWIVTSASSRSAEADDFCSSNARRLNDS